MKKVRECVESNVHNVNDFISTMESVSKTVNKNKNWTFWLKLGIFGTNRIPKWLPLVRTVLIPKENELSQVKKYRPITCCNTAY